ncbi:membrane protein [Dictyobacter sp. S3.2.2.5]|uniref:Membrane protein n=1 Tax=Dictyobacter halimunensis TaxID=3026934 RepID=A0ABQ6FRR3_9CHLR|nr:membrane protein [Dictyobacter sp. S3.2.2.5]
MQIQEQTNGIDIQSASNTSSRVREPDRQAPRWSFWAGIALTALIGLVAYWLAPLPGLAIMGSLTIALILGLAWRVTLKLPMNLTSGVRFSAQKILRLGIILTGVRLNFQLIASSGLQILVLDGLLILFGLTVLPRIGRLLGLSKNFAFLLSVGQSICGASAVGAIAALMPENDEEDTSLAVAVCGIVGTIGVLGFTFIAPLIHLHGTWYGILSGSTLHEIAQVIAAGPAGGPGAAEVATVVKLTRVVYLAPVALVLAFLFTYKAQRQATDGSQGHLKLSKLPIPWFVLGFLLVGAINSFGWFSKDIANLVLQASIFLMVMAMAAMGLLVDVSKLRRHGWRVLGTSLLTLAIFILTSTLLTFPLGLAH